MERPKKSSLYRFRRDVAWREVEGTYHILTADHVYHCVDDEVGRFILKNLGKGATLRQLVQAVKKQFDVAGADVEGDVRHFLDELVQKKIIVRGPSGGG